MKLPKPPFRLLSFSLHLFPLQRDTGICDTLGDGFAVLGNSASETRFGSK